MVRPDPSAASVLLWNFPSLPTSKVGTLPAITVAPSLLARADAVIE